ncbi:helix-turn-helix domain-containing protein [Gordonia sp. w5E2]|uniref:helix-turn-helix domain-containing protein n=1 Tax=Gordonia TaxID=2053 RepID=UPI0022E3EA31|nr:helix-turn-helix domain-containing protein [Gordonia jacobaea]
MNALAPAAPVPSAPRTAREWSEQIAAAMAPFGVDAEPSTPIGWLRTIGSDGLTLSEIVSRPHVAQHFSSPGRPGMVMISVQLSGTATMHVGARTETLLPGDIGVFSSHQSGEVHAGDGYHSLCLALPCDAVEIPPDTLSGTRIAAQTGSMTTVFGDLLRTISRSGDDLTPHQLTRLLHGAAAIGTALLVDTMDTSAIPDPRTRLRRQMYDYIEASLSDPALDVHQLAVAHHLSVRHVHNIFREGGESAAARIRGRRIVRACADLADPARAGVPVAAIAARWGFTTASHFGQVFKATMGCTPAVYRAQALKRVATSVH